MNGIECISITAGITTIIHFTANCFGYCINNEDKFKEI